MRVLRPYITPVVTQILSVDLIVRRQTINATPCVIHRRNLIDNFSLQIPGRIAGRLCGNYNEILELHSRRHVIIFRFSSDLKEFIRNRSELSRFRRVVSR